MQRITHRALRLSHSKDAHHERGMPEVFAASSRSLELTSSTCVRVLENPRELSITKSAYFTFSSKGIWERMRASICSSDNEERARKRCLCTSGVQVTTMTLS